MSFNCSAKPGRGLRLRIRSEKSYQSRHHQRHSQRQLQSITASHHLFSRQTKLKTNHPRHAAVHTMPLAHECIQVSKPIQNLIIISSSAERRKLMTWSRVWALFPSTRSGIQPQGLKVTDVGWKESAKKTQNKFRLFTWSFYCFQVQSWSNPYDLPQRTCRALQGHIDVIHRDSPLHQATYFMSMSLAPANTPQSVFWGADADTFQPANPGYMVSSFHHRMYKKRPSNGKYTVYSLYINMLQVQ